MIQIDDFHKAYDTTVAVKGLSLQVTPGQILGLVGPNGAGKTTTMRAVAGIFPISQGHISVAGFDVEQEPIEAKRRLAYVPDDPQLFGDLTVLQHLAFIGSTYQVTEVKQRVSELLVQFELLNNQNMRAADLSRGMRQKLAICCAYLYDPQVILCDEPLTGLDPLGIRTLKTSLLRRAESGAAIMISSHLLAMVEDICSHVLILDQGQQTFCGSTDELKGAFANSHDDVSLEEIFFLATGTEMAHDEIGV